MVCFHTVIVNTLLTAVGLALLGVLTATTVVLALEIRRAWREVVLFVSPVAENEESPLGVALDALAHRVGQAVAVEVKTTLMGKESGLKRAENAVAAGITQDILAEKQPVLAGILSGFPTLKKTLLKNPGLVGAALNLLSGNGQAGGKALGPNTGGNGAENSKSAFQI